MLDHYPGGLWRLIRQDWDYSIDHPVDTLVMVIGLLALFYVRSRGDLLVSFLRAAAVASIAYVCILPNYTAFRLELAVLPLAASGLTILADRRGRSVFVPP